MKIIRVETGFLKENCYILIINNKCLVIDPGDDYFKIKEKLKDLEVLGILITHGHFDHIGAIDDLLNEHNVNIYKFDNLSESSYNIGPFNFEVIFNPGHSEDSISYYFKDDNVIFDGDFIFKGTIGRCDLKGGNINKMKESLLKFYNRFSDVILMPGHGSETNINNEKNNYSYKI
ncbi:MAG: MBL fold metallo-hydrolase [bacterium]|nr:MBL fold metallo-hydrolase [bacterium]